LTIEHIDASHHGGDIAAMTIKKTIGRRIRLVRENLNMTQSEFANKIKVSPATVSGWELGDIGISIAAAIRVAKFSAVSLDWLLMGESDRVSEHPAEELTPEETRLLVAFRVYDRTAQSVILWVTEAGAKD
jgi:transcriptional regulator with XRE-family HTH domain